MIERNCLDPFCPCQDGDSCHYAPTPTTEAWPIPVEYMIPGKMYDRILPEDESDES